MKADSSRARRDFIKLAGLAGTAAFFSASQAAAQPATAPGATPSAHGPWNVRDFGATGDGTILDTPRSTTSFARAA